MKKYILKRVFTGFLSVVVSFVITFFLVKTAPGDPIRLLTGIENPNPELVQHLTEYYGLDKPLTEQFTIHVRNLVKGDFGYSYVSNKPVWDIITARLPVTLLLSTTSVPLSMILGVLFAVISSIASWKWIRRRMDGINYLKSELLYFRSSSPWNISMPSRLNTLITITTGELKQD